MHDDDTDSDDLFDFAMNVLNTRPGPCKAATAPEVDPVEARLERERHAAPFVDHAFAAVRNGRIVEHKMAVEVRHGSGKVKV